MKVTKTPAGVTCWSLRELSVITAPVVKSVMLTTLTLDGSVPRAAAKAASASASVPGFAAMSPALSGAEVVGVRLTPKTRSTSFAGVGVGVCVGVGVQLGVGVCDEVGVNVGVGESDAVVDGLGESELVGVELGVGVTDGVTV